jgi:hypothetical protein
MRRFLRPSIALLTLVVAALTLWVPAGRAQGPITQAPPPAIVITPAPSTTAGGDGAPTTAEYIVKTPSSGLSAEQALSLLATGLVKNTTTTGVLSIATANTDYVSPSVSVEAVTSTKTPSASTELREVYTNEGDADGATVTLPTAAAGLSYTVYVQAGQTLTVTAASGDTIRISGNVTAAAGSITSAVVGSAVVLVAINATEWVAVAATGTWTF